MEAQDMLAAALVHNGPFARTSLKPSARSGLKCATARAGHALRARHTSSDPDGSAAAAALHRPARMAKLGDVTCLAADRCSLASAMEAAVPLSTDWGTPISQGGFGLAAQSRTCWSFSAHYRISRSSRTSRPRRLQSYSRHKSGRFA